MSNIRLDAPRFFRGTVNVADSEWLFNQAKSQAGQDLFAVAMTQGKQAGTWLEIGCGDPIRSNNTYLLEKRLGWNGISIDLQRMDHDIITPFEEYWAGFYDVIRRPHWPRDVVPPAQLPDHSWQSLPYYQNFIGRQLTDIDDIPLTERTWCTARPNTRFYQTNALEFDYALVPEFCDYLQIDIHPSSHNLLVLEALLPHHRFAVVTFEHDVWDRSNHSAMVRHKSRQILSDHGYHLVISDATVPPGHGNGIDNEPINFEDWWVDPCQIGEHVWKPYANCDNSGEAKYYYHTLFRSQDLLA